MAQGQVAQGQVVQGQVVQGQVVQSQMVQGNCEQDRSEFLSRYIVPANCWRLLPISRHLRHSGSSWSCWHRFDRFDDAFPTRRSRWLEELLMKQVEIL